MIFVDPTGMSADWIAKDGTYEYEWRDDVNSQSDTPEGYRYVGESDESILSDMNLPNNLETKKEIKKGAGLEENNKGIVVTRAKSFVEGGISVSADVNYSASDRTENNKMGKTFSGITVEANFTEASYGTNSGSMNSFTGYLEVTTSTSSKTSQLKSPQGSFVYDSSKKPSVASISYSAKEVANGSFFKQARISAGSTNAGLIKSPKPVDMRWSLIKNSIIHD